MVLFGDIIRAFRVNKRMTQAELSKRLGVSRTMISSYETLNRHPSHETLVKMTGIFNCSMDELYGLNKVDKIKKYIEVTGMNRAHRHLIEELVDVILEKDIMPGDQG